MRSVMAVFGIHGDSEELPRYDAAIHQVVAAFEHNEDFCRVLRDADLPEFKLGIYPVHNLGWPLDATPLYR